ncbi:MAG TPA: SRPBCC family protein [Solirubrobacteraceae bacterium]|nr:SRPBCC family protein [Solirubrobacteraceae bacterium]
MSMTKNGSAGPQEPLAKGLGVLSFALGIPQVLAPGRMNRMIGVRDDAKSRMWMRAVGVREIAAGVGIFSSRKPTEWVWARVAGDTMDLVLLGSALRNRSESPARTLAATGAVVGAFAADLVDGVQLTRSEEAPQQQAGPIQVRTAITVRRDRDELYSHWRDFTGFPDFMTHLEEVQDLGSGRSRWSARGPLGVTVSWEAEITEDLPGERISWRSVEASRVTTSGTVRFVPAPGDQGTEVHLDMHYDVPGGAIGSTIAKLSGEEPAIQIKDDLRRFKQIVETGEIARSDGTPEGTRGMRMLKQRPAQPLPDDKVESMTSGGTS